MIKQDHERIHSVKKSKSGVFQGLQLWIVQCSVCLLLLLVVLTLRWIGSDVFTDISARFENAMLDDTLFTAVSSAIHIETVSASVPVTAPLRNGIITDLFGERENGTFHEGIDIAAEEGTPLAAMLDGTVTTVAYEENGYGHYAVVTCESGNKYLYAHCSSIAVMSGTNVKAGDTIAYVGNTGRSSGSHVHLEWICNDVTIDPITIIPEQTYA